MHYQPVVDRFVVPVPMDPIAAMIFVALFTGTMLLTMRRPAAGLTAMILTQPIAWAHHLFGTDVTISKVVLVAAAIAAASSEGAVRYLRDRPLRPALIAGLAVVAATFLTIVVAEQRAPVVRETLKATEYLLLLVTAYAIYRLDPDDRLYRRALAGIVIVVSLSALLQEAIGAPSGLQAGDGVIPRIAGFLEGPNQLAGYLEGAIAVLAAWFVVRAERLIAVALAFAACTLLLTFSRAGIAAFGLEILLAAAIYRRASRVLIAPLAAGSLAGIGGIALWAHAVHSFMLFRLSPAESEYAGGVGNRSQLWRAAWYFFRTHPVLGIGAGNYELQLPRAGVYGVRTHANSLPLQTLAEGGLVLFATLATFFAVLVRALLRGMRGSPWAAGAFMATIALLAHQLVDDLFFYPKAGGPWIIAVALGIAAYARASEVSCD